MHADTFRSTNSSLFLKFKDLFLPLGYFCDLFNVFARLSKLGYIFKMKSRTHKSKIKFMLHPSF